jgi:hypothetical protein
MKALLNKKAIVTGASAGIGRATALKLLEAGCDVLLLARRAERLESLKNEWSSKFPDRKIITEVCDLHSNEQIDQTFQKNKTWLEGLNILVNNAGLARGSDTFQNAQWEHWDEMIDINLKSLLYVTRKLIANLEKNEGHILNLGSVAGRWVYPGGSVYCATKFAVRAISDGLRQDLLGKNVRVTNIEPGMVETEFSEVRFQDKEKAKNVYKNMRPLSSEDIADTILWTLSRPAHVNIQELVIYPTDQASPTQVFRHN